MVCVEVDDAEEEMLFLLSVVWLYRCVVVVCDGAAAVSYLAVHWSVAL